MNFFRPWQKITRNARTKSPQNKSKAMPSYKNKNCWLAIPRQRAKLLCLTKRPLVSALGLRRQKRLAEFVTMEIRNGACCLLWPLTIHTGFLQNLFQCSPNTVTAARVHSILFGRGGVLPDNFKFRTQRVSAKVLEELTEFLNPDDIARASSCRGVLVDGEKTAVRYWQDSIKSIVQQYLLENPDGVKRTFLYTHLSQNFQMNTMLAGLCNLCDEYGHSNFDAMCELIQEIASLRGGETTTIDHACLAKHTRNHQTFLKRKFPKLAERHCSCLELCLRHTFGTCSEEHSDSLQEMT